jgi:hypothetical protein
VAGTVVLDFVSHLCRHTGTLWVSASTPARPIHAPTLRVCGDTRPRLLFPHQAVVTRAQARTPAGQKPQISERINMVYSTVHERCLEWQTRVSEEGGKFLHPNLATETWEKVQHAQPRRGPTERAPSKTPLSHEWRTGRHKCAMSCSAAITGNSKFKMSPWC